MIEPPLVANNANFKLSLAEMCLPDIRCLVQKQQPMVSEIGEAMTWLDSQLDLLDCS